MPTFDLRGEIVTEDGQHFAIRGANMSWKVAGSRVFTAERRKQEQVGKRACCQPRKPAAVINPPERQASVAIEAVPAKVGDLPLFAAHGLHGIPEQRLYMSDCDRHVRSNSFTQAGVINRYIRI